MKKLDPDAVRGLAEHIIDHYQIWCDADLWTALERLDPAITAAVESSLRKLRPCIYASFTGRDEVVCPKRLCVCGYHETSPEAAASSP